MKSLYIVSVFFNLFCFMYCSLSWIELYGTWYTYGGVVVIDSDLLPKFGVIKDVIMDSSFHFYFIVEVLHTICCMSHHHAHEVIEHSPPTYQLIKPSDLVDHSVLGLYTIPNSHSYFVSLKYYLKEQI